MVNTLGDIMKASDLVTIWSAPDNSRLTTKQFSFRLPVHVAAKLAALEALYPTRSRTQLVGDLLAAAIDDIEKKLPSFAGKPFGVDPDSGEDLFEATGPVATYRKLANNFYSEIEREMGNENPAKLFTQTDIVYADKE